MVSDWLQGSRLRYLWAPLLVVIAAHCRAPEEHWFRIAHEADFVSLDPIRATDSISKSVLSNICDPLVALNSEMQLTAALAESWTSPDDSTWLFHLRAGVHFQNGRPLRSEDVRASIERTRSNSNSLLRDRLSTIDGVESAGPLQVRIRTRGPDPFLLYRLSDVFITPEGSVGPGERPVGTGPYAFGSNRGGILALTAFDGCWRGKPWIRKVQFVAIKSESERIRALRTGSVDLLRWAPPAWADHPSPGARMRLVSRRGLRVLFLWMDSRRSDGEPNPFADPRVRQAVSLAINRTELVARIGGHASPSNQFVPPGISGFVPDLPALPYDLKKAGALLGQAGYPEGFETTLTSIPVAALGDALVQMLRVAGIRARRSEVAWPAMLREWRASHLAFFLGGWSFSMGDSAQFFDECVRSPGPNATSAWNPGYSNPEIDALLSEDFRNPSRTIRKEQLAGVTDRLLTEMPIVPLFIWHDLYAVRAGLHFQPRLDGALHAFAIGAE